MVSLTSESLVDKRDHNLLSLVVYKMEMTFNNTVILNTLKIISHYSINNKTDSFIRWVNNSFLEP